MQRSLVLAGSIAVVACGCDVVFGLHGFSHDAGSIDAPADAGIDAAPLGPPSCKAILADDPSATSGMYEIDPDGGGGEPLLPVNCDMTTAGGGWTLVFIAPSTNLQTPPVPYTSNSPALRAMAQEALMVFRDGTLAPLAGAATFPMPPEWRDKSPFEYPANDFPTMVSIDGAAAVSATVRYGQQTFTQLCTDAWQAGTMWGRVCVTGTTAPFYTGWNRDVIDSCVASNAVFSTAACSTSKVFTIAVR